MPLAQRALHHLFPEYPLGGFGDRPFPERCWRWSAGSWFDSLVVIEGNRVRKSGSPRTGLLDRNSFRVCRHSGGTSVSIGECPYLAGHGGLGEATGWPDGRRMES